MSEKRNTPPPQKMNKYLYLLQMISYQARPGQVLHANVNTIMTSTIVNHLWVGEGRSMAKKKWTWVNSNIQIK